MAREVIIRIIGDDKDIDKTINKLVQMGQVDEKNAKQFEANNSKYKALQNEKLGTIEKLRLKEKTLTDLRDKSQNPKNIKRYNELIDKQRSKVNELTKTTSQQVTGLEKLTNTLQTVGITIGVAFAAQKLIAFAGELRDLSMMLETDAQKAAIVFGDQLDSVTKKALENANAIGLTTNEYIKAAASTQDLLVPLKFTREEAAKMSADLTDLSGALSIWSGGQYDSAEASQIVTKAILGETEQLKQLGILIDQSSPDFNNRIKQSMALDGVTREQARATDILNQIMEKSVDAQANFSDGQKTVAQKSAETNAILREQKEALAKELLPVWGYLEDELAKYIKTQVTWLETTKAGFEVIANFITGKDEEVAVVKKATEARKAEEVEVQKQIVSINTLKIELSELQKEYAEVEVGSERFNELGVAIAKAEARINSFKKKVSPELSPLKELQKQISDVTAELNDQSIGGDIREDTMRKYIDLTNQLAAAQINLKDKIFAASDIEKVERRSAVDALTEHLALTDELQTEADNKFIDDQRDKFATVREMENMHSQEVQQIALNQVGELSNVFSLYNNSRIAEIDQLVAKEIITEEQGTARKKAVLRQQAVADKLFRSFGIITKTAEAVAGALATLPNPAALPLAFLAGSLGAAQLGIVASTPIPGFAKGTKGKKGGGLSRVGEEGEELMYIPDGAKILPNKQTVEHGAIIDAMYDNKLDDFILKNYLPRLLPKGMPKDQKDAHFINSLTNKLGSEGFNEDGIIDTMKKLDRKEDARTGSIVKAILSAQNKRVNLRN